MVNETVISLLLWASIHTGYPIPEKPITLLNRPQRVVEQTYSSLTGSQSRGSVKAFYNRTLDYIMYTDNGDLMTRSTLVHELTHWLQNHNGASFSCSREREAEAYVIMFEYLQEQGVSDPASFVGIGDNLLTKITTCNIGEFRP